MDQGELRVWPGVADVAPAPAAAMGPAMVAVAPPTAAAGVAVPSAPEVPAVHNPAVAAWAGAPSWQGDPVPRPVPPVAVPPGRASRTSTGRGLLRGWKPERRDYLIGGAILAAVAVTVTLAILFTRGAEPQEQPVRFAFDSEAIGRITDGMESAVQTPGTTDSQGDSGGGVWNFGPTTPGGGVSPGTSGGSVSPGSSGGSYGGTWQPGSSGGSSSRSGSGTPSPEPEAAPAAVPMPPGGYTYSASGTGQAKFWGPAQALAGAAAAAVTSSGACSTLAITSAGGISSTEVCATGGALLGRTRSRVLAGGGSLTLACGDGAPLVPAGARSGQAWDVSCTASAIGLSEDLAGTASLSGGGGAWTVTTRVTRGGDVWDERVLLDQASGRIMQVETKAKFAILGYDESSQYTLQ